ncbi:MFS transporter [Anaerobacillus alkaliphilus]|uniref:MFS transporter n=1 Tax=Anaerobacillus alkaliphilus TaxID=1548597 RepID=A0A4V1LGY1_9BACI|nr:MFS transporter [Anaerobacillus alkaliphilus]RXJ04315.1 MFS transporter [Anaerobacillus alkaliphilus]
MSSYLSIFQNRNFRALFFGRIITNIGDSLYAVAAMWLVFELGGSTLYTGLAGFLSFFPRIIQFLSGPLIDRYALKSILVITQFIQCILLLIIPVAAYFDFLSVTLVLIVTPIITTFNMFVYPAQSAALPKILEDHQLMKGNSLFTFAYQGVEMSFNAIAGILIASVGAVTIYFIDSLTFLIGLLIFLQIRLPDNRIHSKEKDLKQFIRTYHNELLEGAQLLFKTFLSRLLLGAIVLNMVIGATFVVLPAYASEQGGPEIYGFLLMAAALGSLMGALLAPFLKLERFKIGSVYAGAFGLAGILWALSMIMPWTWLTILVFGLGWAPGGATNILINTVIQRVIPKEMLGRVFSTAVSMSGIAMPIGSLLGGVIGAFVGSTVIIFTSGLIVIGIAIFWMVDKVSRTIPSGEELNSSHLKLKNNSKLTFTA